MNILQLRSHLTVRKLKDLPMTTPFILLLFITTFTNTILTPQDDII